MLLVIQIVQVTQNLLGIECPDSIQVDLEILDEMFHDPDDLVMRLQQICLVFLINGIRHKFVKSIAQVSHPVHRREGIGILEILVFHADNPTDMLQFMGRPVHGTFGCNIIFVTGHTPTFTHLLFRIVIPNKRWFEAYNKYPIWFVAKRIISTRLLSN